MKKQERAEKELKKVQDLATNLDGVELTFKLRVGKDGKPISSVTKTKIAEELKKLGYFVKNSQILLRGSIKEFGEFPVKILLPHNLETEIKVIVAEKND